MLSCVPGIYRCDDITAARQTWTFYTDGMEQTWVRGLVSPPTGKAHLYSVVADVGGFRHDDLGVSPPNFAPSMDSELALDFAQADPAKMVRTGSKQPFGAYSGDGGKTWSAFTVPKGVKSGGSAAISADGKSIVWVPGGTANGFVSSDHGKSWAVIAGPAGGVMPAADRVNPGTFYAYAPATGNLYRSTDGGRTFAKIQATVGQKGHAMVLNPAAAGDWWIGGESGLSHSTDGGTTWSTLGGVAKVYAIGLGKAKTADGYPAIYLAGQVKEARGIFRSDDEGATWTQISDDAHHFAGADVVIGDPRLYGRVYLGTNGRGVMYGDPRQP
jgi:photosystem II stability/assembly factor-like uncharacterized protein